MPVTAHEHPESAFKADDAIEACTASLSNRVAVSHCDCSDSVILARDVVAKAAQRKGL